MKYYFITGASKGIGKALTQAILQDKQSYVYGFSRSVSVRHERYHHQPLDLSDITALRNNLHKVFVGLPHPEKIVLINNAAVVGEIGYIGHLPNDNFEFVMDVNVVGPAILMNTFLSTYQHHACPKIIINISSGAAQRPIDGWAGYCASKAALDMLSLTCQQEQDLQHTGVKVFSLSPGVVDTAMQAHIREAPEGQFSQLKRFKALKENNDLQSPVAVANKIINLINNPIRNQVQVSIRDL